MEWSELEGSETYQTASDENREKIWNGWQNDFGADYPDTVNPLEKPAPQIVQPTVAEDAPDFTPGVQRGLQNLQASLHGATALVGKGLKELGAENVGQNVQDFGMEGYRRNIEEAKKYPKKHSFKDIYTGKTDVGGAIDWAQGTLGELVPSMVEAATGAVVGSMVAPGPGTITGGLASRTVLKKGIEKIIQQQMKKGIGDISEAELRKQVTKQAIKKLSGKAGMGAAVMPMETGGMYAGLLEEKGIDAPETALLFGALATSLEFLGGNSKLVDTFVDALGSTSGGAIKKASKELLYGIPKNTWQEALQEGGQGAFEILNTVINTDEKLFTKEHLEEVIENMAAGAVGGGFGGVAQAVMKPSQDPGTGKTDPDTEIDRRVARILTQDNDDIARSIQTFNNNIQTNNDLLNNTQELNAKAEELNIEPAELIARIQDANSAIESMVNKINAGIGNQEVLPENREAGRSPIGEEPRAYEDTPDETLLVLLGKAQERNLPEVVVLIEEEIQIRKETGRRINKPDPNRKAATTRNVQQPIEDTSQVDRMEEALGQSAQDELLADMVEGQIDVADQTDVKNRQASFENLQQKYQEQKEIRLNEIAEELADIRSAFHTETNPVKKEALRKQVFPLMEERDRLNNVKTDQTPQTTQTEFGSPKTPDEIRQESQKLYDKIFNAQEPEKSAEESAQAFEEAATRQAEFDAAEQAYNEYEPELPAKSKARKELTNEVFTNEQPDEDVAETEQNVSDLDDYFKDDSEDVSDIPAEPPVEYTPKPGESSEEASFHQIVLDTYSKELKDAYMAGNLEIPQYMIALELLARKDIPALQQLMNALDAVKPTEDGPMLESTSSFKAKGKADLERLIQMLGSQMYKENLAEVTIKELVQNSFDAVKASLNAKGAKKIKEGQIDIITDPDSRIIAIRDNGQGMTKKVLLDAFLTVAGTDKSGMAEGSASGGFGMAKAAFLYGNEWIEVNTVKNGRRYSFKGTGSDIISKGIKVKSEKAHPAEHGTTIVIKVPEHVDVDGKQKYVWFPEDIPDIAFFKQPLIHDSIEINTQKNYLLENEINDLSNSKSDLWDKVNFEPIKVGKNIDLSNYEKPTKITFDWGTAELYIGKTRIANRWRIKHNILSAGVYQFDHAFNMKMFEKVPYDIILNIFPTSPAESAAYPFNVRREGWKDNIAEDIKSLDAYVKNIAMGIEAQETVDQFKNIQSLPRIDVDDIGTDNIDMTDFFKPPKDETTKEDKTEFPATPTEVNVNDGKVSVVDDQGKVLIVVDVNEKDTDGTALDSSFEAEKEAPKAKDFLIDIGIDDSQPIFHNNTTTDYFELARQNGYSAETFFAEFGSLILKVKDIFTNKYFYGYDVLEDKDQSFFFGTSIDKGYHGANLVVPFKGILVNPLAIKERSLPGIVHGLYDTFIHEFAHIPQRNHEQGFSEEVAKLKTALASDGTDLEIRVALGRLIKKHKNLIELMRNEYEKSTTKNVAKSLNDTERSDAIASRRPANESDGSIEVGDGERAGAFQAGEQSEERSGISVGDQTDERNVEFKPVDITSPNFKRWFEGSQVTDGNGNPLKVYHGSTTFGISEDGQWAFDSERLGKSTKSPRTGLGHFFATNINESLGYTSGGKGVVNSVYLNIKNPLEINSHELPVFNNAEEARAYAKRRELDGYDGILIKDEGHYIVFDSTQVKSAEKNTGEFDPNNPDIRFQTTEGQEAINKVNFADIQKAFPVQTVIQDPDGAISVQLKNGKGLRIKSIKNVNNATGAVELAIETGQMSNNGKILGVTVGNKIILDADFADNNTLWHENKHVLDNLGMITDADNSALNREFNKLRKANKLEFALSTHKDSKIAMEENRANMFAQIMVNREAYRNTPFGKVIQRVMDFFQQLLGFGKQTIAGLAREVESGKIYERQVDGQTVNVTIPQNEVTASKWYSTLENAVAGFQQKQATPAQWKGMIKNIPGVKDEELEWMGLNEWLDSHVATKDNTYVTDLSDHEIDLYKSGGIDAVLKAKNKKGITREALLKFIQMNNVQLEEVVKEDDGKGITDISQNYDSLPQEIRNIFEYTEDSESLLNGDRGLTTKEKVAIEMLGYIVEADMDGIPYAIYKKGTNPTQYNRDSLTIPGGKNYKELILTLPSIDQRTTREKLGEPKEVNAEEFEEIYGAEPRENHKLLSYDGVYILQAPNGKYIVETYAEDKSFDTLEKAEDYLYNDFMVSEGVVSEPESYRSSHWEGIKNPLAHIRFNERTDADGNKILFIEEVQSDWHQQGRKEGYQGDNIIEETSNGWVVKNKAGKIILHNIPSEEKARELQNTDEVLDAPFKKSWPLLAMKRMVRYAAENGFDKIAWTTGDQQADRYDLSKQVDYIESQYMDNDRYSINAMKDNSIIIDEIFTKDKLSNVVGKELAEKIIQHHKENPSSGGNINKGHFSGLDLKVGGEGMKGFYDKMLPSMLNKEFNRGKWGKAKVEVIESRNQEDVRVTKEEALKAFEEGKMIFLGDEFVRPDLSIASAKAEIENYQGTDITAVQSGQNLALPITNRMVSKALREGMPMFQVAEAAPEQKLPQSYYNRIHAEKQNLLKNYMQKARIYFNEARLLADKAFGSISTRLGNVDPELPQKLRQLDLNTSLKIIDILKAAQPILDATHGTKNKLGIRQGGMEAQDKTEWNVARLQADKGKIEQIAQKYGLTNHLVNLREKLNQVRADAIAVGYDVGYIDEYWPRVIKDREGFLQATEGISQDPVFSQAIRAEAKKLGITQEQFEREFPDVKADIISNLILGNTKGIGGPGNIQARVFETIPEEYLPFYMDADAALMQYVYSMTKKIEARKFFGKVPKRISDLKAQQKRINTELIKVKQLADMARFENPEALAKHEARITELNENLVRVEEPLNRYKKDNRFDENIGAYIDRMRTETHIKNGKEVPRIEAKDEKIVRDILDARFHEHGTHGIVNAYKNAAYIDTMGSFISAATQIGDLAWAMYVGKVWTPKGFTDTSKNLIKALFKKSDITKEDLGIERIAQEFADGTTMSKAVSKVFKLVGLEHIDSIGKETLINNALAQYKAEAKADPKALEKSIRPTFGKESANVVQEILAYDPNNVNSKPSDNIKMLLYSRLLDFQPVALSEMPEYYLSGGNLRVLYMLKTYTMKQFDVFRREIFQNLKSKDAQLQAQGIINMVKLMSLLTLANATADELKDFMLGREVKFSDNVMENFLTIGGASRYQKMQVSREGFGSAMLQKVLPPMKFINSASKDMHEGYKDYVSGDTYNFEHARIIDSIPGVGKLYYWHAGRGAENKKSIAEQEFKKDSKDARLFKKQLENSDDKRVFIQSNFDRFKRMKLQENFQKPLNTNKAETNKLEKLIKKLEGKPQTVNVQTRLGQLKAQREQILQRYSEVAENMQ